MPPIISTPSRLSHNLKRNENLWITAATLAFPYVATGFVIWLSESLGQRTSYVWSVRLLALPIIAALQNHLQILSHEGAHYQLHPRKNWNDFLTNLFCTMPFFGLIRHYRFFHLQHHRHLLDPEKDPEIEFYAEQGYFFEKQNTQALLKMLFLDFCGYHYFQFFFSYNRYLVQETRSGRMKKLSTQERNLTIFVSAIVLILLLHPYTAFLFLFYWILPQPTFLFFFLKQQGYGEHTLRTKTIESCTHSHNSNFLIRFFIYPFNSNLHREHHLYPSVPWYRLKRYPVPFSDATHKKKEPGT